MEVVVHGRHKPIPAELRRFATEKVLHLGRFLSTISSIDVEIFTDGQPKHGNGQVVHVTVETTGPVFRSKVSADDPRTAIEIAAARLERRLKEFKRKRSGKPPHLKRKPAKLESGES